MGRITETNCAAVGVIMATVYVAKERNIYWRMQKSEVHLALMGLRWTEYIELSVRFHTAGEF